MKQETEQDKTGMTVKEHILQEKAWVEKQYARYWEREAYSDFYEFQKALIIFYQNVRVYIERTDGYEDLIEEMDRILQKGGEDVNSGEWLNYYNRINSALYDAGVLDVIKAPGL